MPKHEARRLLGIDDDEKVLLAFGGFRHEEECNIAVSGFQDAKNTIPRLRLLAPRLPEKYGFGNGKPVESKLLPLYFAASDVVLIARKRILNSGNLPLGYYFGKPVVGPDVGDVGEILRETGNPVFDVCDPSSVGRSIVAAFAAIKDGLGAHNREYAERNWNISRVVDLLYDVYQAPMSEAQMMDERRIILRDNGVPPAVWALDAMFEAIWEKVMARPCQDCTPDPRKMKGNGIYKEQYSDYDLLEMLDVGPLLYLKKDGKKYMLNIETNSFLTGGSIDSYQMVDTCHYFTLMKNKKKALFSNEGKQ